jgi:hypothetical protein
MKNMASMAALITVLGTSFAFAQSNPNLEKNTGTVASVWALQHSVTGNPNNPTAADYYRYHRTVPFAVRHSFRRRHR